MPFSESLKSRVRRRAFFACCICQSKGVEVHHVVPQEEGGPDIEENAAPLCPSCHETYGANPQKRKFIKEARDHWYEVCEKRFTTDIHHFNELKDLLKGTVSRDDFAAFKADLLNQVKADSPTQMPPTRNLRTLPNQPYEGHSESGKLEFELRGELDSGSSVYDIEIWVWEAGQKASAAKLTTTQAFGNLRIHFSPDDNWILVRDGGSSSGIDVRLFQRQHGSSFVEIEAHIGDKAESFAYKLNGLPEKQILHHRYISCLLWSLDSSAVLLAVSGYGHYSETSGCGLNWRGIYDLETREFTQDLSRLNRGSVQVWNRDSCSGDTTS